MLVYATGGSAPTILRAATLQTKLQIKLSTSPSHSIWHRANQSQCFPYNAWRLTSLWYGSTRKNPHDTSGNRTAGPPLSRRTPSSLGQRGNTWTVTRRWRVNTGGVKGIVPSRARSVGVTSACTWYQWYLLWSLIHKISCNLSHTSKTKGSTGPTPPRWPSGKASASRAEDRVQLALGFFRGSSHTSDLKIGTPVATLQGAYCYRISAGTGRPGVSLLWLGEVESLICYFYLSVAARKIVQADPSLRYTRMLLGR